MDSDGNNVRTITRIEKLEDVSIVLTFPAYPDAQAGLRSLEQNKNKLTTDLDVKRKRLGLFDRLLHVG